MTGSAPAPQGTDAVARSNMLADAEGRGEEALVGAVAPPGLHVMSFNIRRRVASAWRPSDRWERRAPYLRALLRAEQPALLGVQEALPGQAAFVQESLGARYRFVGRGRQADGLGEGCPVYYDADRLELTAWEQTALSDRPTVPGSMSWGNRVPRIVVSATFRDRATSSSFVAVNTHLDHSSRRSRLRSAEALRTLVAHQPLPTVVTGDFNTGAGTAPAEELLADGALVDSWVAARTRITAEWGTFPDYREPRQNRKRIDWIAVSPRTTVVQAAINPRRYAGGWGSDHLPVQAVVILPEAADR